MNQILVIEDDKDIAFLVAMHLRDHGAIVDISHHGDKGLAKALASHYDLVILDLMLPGMDGLEVCRHIRNQDTYTPILMLTARSTELDRVLGLEIGADDYLSKPFSVRELVARTKAICRRMAVLKQAKMEEPQWIQCGDLTVNYPGHTAVLAEKNLDLTAREFDLLWHFIRHPGQVFSRSQLLDAVWGYSHDGYEHTVNSHINRLRAKLEQDSSQPKYILTVWGVGYKFTTEEAKS